MHFRFRNEGSLGVKLGHKMFFIRSSGRFLSDNGLIGFSKIVDFGFELHANFENLRRRVFVLVVGVHCHGHG